MNKKGSTMVESALVFPLVVLSLVAIIMILVFLLSENVVRVEAHHAIRVECGERTGTYIGESKNTDVTIVRKQNGVFSILEGTQNVHFNGSGILEGAYNKSVCGFQHLLDEQKYIRYADLFISEGE